MVICSSAIALFFSGACNSQLRVPLQMLGVSLTEDQAELKSSINGAIDEGDLRKLPSEKFAYKKLPNGRYLLAFFGKSAQTQVDAEKRVGELIKHILTIGKPVSFDALSKQNEETATDLFRLLTKRNPDKGNPISVSARLQESNQTPKRRKELTTALLKFPINEKQFPLEESAPCTDEEFNSAFAKYKNVVSGNFQISVSAIALQTAGGLPKMGDDMGEAVSWFVKELHKRRFAGPTDYSILWKKLDELAIVDARKRLNQRSSIPNNLPKDQTPLARVLFNRANDLPDNATKSDYLKSVKQIGKRYQINIEFLYRSEGQTSDVNWMVALEQVKAKS